MGSKALPFVKNLIEGGRGDDQENVDPSGPSAGVKHQSTGAKISRWGSLKSTLNFGEESILTDERTKNEAKYRHKTMVDYRAAVPLGERDTEVKNDVKTQITLLRKLKDFIVQADYEGVKELLEKKDICIDVPVEDEENGYFITVLGLVAVRPHLGGDSKTVVKMMSLFLDKGASLNARSDRGQTALILACKAKNLPAVQLLLERGARVDCIDAKGWSALCGATALMRSENQTAKQHGILSAVLIELLISYNANRNGEVNGVVPLSVAIQHSNFMGVQMLLQLGATCSRDAVLIQGLTLKRAQALPIVASLVNGGANPFLMNEDGETAMSIAKGKYGDEDPCYLLMMQAADAWEESFTVDDAFRVASSYQADQEQQTLQGGARIGDAKKPSAAHIQFEVEEQKTWRTSFNNWILSWEAPAKKLNKSTNFQFCMLLVLVFALFAPDAWTLFDVKENTSLDVLLIICIILFGFEIGVQMFALKEYKWSFFFWMDLLGMASCVGDFEFVLQMTSASGNESMAVLQATKMLKLVARSGRFFRLVKLLKFLPGMGVSQDGGRSGGTARRLNDRLTMAVSLRVSFLIIVMVIVLPVFSMLQMRSLEQDNAIVLWPERLAKEPDADYGDLVTGDLDAFYTDPDRDDYRPYNVWKTLEYAASKSQLSFDGKENLGHDTDVAVKRVDYLKKIELADPPGRVYNRLKVAETYEVPTTDRATLYPNITTKIATATQDEAAGKKLFVTVVMFLDFHKPRQTEALFNMLVILLVIILLLTFAFALQGVAHRVVRTPLEELLSVVQNLGAKMFQSVADMSSAMADGGAEESDDEDEDQDDDKDDGNGGGMFEAELLEKIQSKLQLLTDLAMRKNEITADENIKKYTQTLANQTLQWVAQEEDLRDEDYLRRHRVALMQAGLTLDDVESFDFNTLDLDDFQTYAVLMWFICGEQNNLGAYLQETLNIDERRLIHFFEEVGSRYKSTNAYHNWLHAVDVTHATYQLMTNVKSREYLSKAERFGLICAAVCHDVGHPGVNNPYLIESAHDLALRYNDKSPLENMHAAIMFEIAYAGKQKTKTSLFHACSRSTYMEIRKVAIDAIIKTDMVYHFPMVSEMRLMIEEQSEMVMLCHEAYWTGMQNMAKSGSSGSSWELPFDALEFWKLPEKRESLRAFILHVADISNPVRPFPVSRAWSYLVLEEFFQQGDMEKKFGYTVQMLNDRDKVNKPHSQIGFIEFVVSPLYFNMAALWPPLHHCVETLLTNLHQWEAEWVEEMNPSQKELQATHSRVEKTSDTYRDLIAQYGDADVI